MKARTEYDLNLSSDQNKWGTLTESIMQCTDLRVTNPCTNTLCISMQDEKRKTPQRDLEKLKITEVNKLPIKAA